ncbi:MAG: alpha-amylase family glycosyl hydrolase [Bacteroidota bacterium]|nr:alpha-amylase family glycosyl hydrolase [Bacteroidota bacterium]
MRVKSKIFLLFSLVLITFSKFSAQGITVYPSFPTENDSIVIEFDAKASDYGKELVGYTGDLYAHTGVTVTSTWQFVIGGDNSWGNNDVEPKLTRIKDDVYRLVIGNPRKFYGLKSSDGPIKAICLVFRSADKTKQSRPDIFLALYQTGLNLTINSPSQFPIFSKLNDTISVKATASNAVKISLFENNNLITESNDSILTYKLITKQYGKRRVRIVAQDGSGTTKADSFYYVVNPPLSLKELPSGVVDGINYSSNTSVTLSLYAPSKKFAYVIGDFNDWEADSAYFMYLTPDSSHFWITLNNLTPQNEYGFQYYVDGQIKIADPYTDKVLDPANDKYISSQTYPNLKAYPTLKTDNIVSVFQTAQPQYQWQANSYKRPNKNSLVIYELLVRDFTSLHSYKALADTVNYLARLGVTAVELMPVNEFEGNDSWGYNPSFYFAPDKYYGPKEDLKSFIDECHKRNIAVIIDLVLNHSYGQSPLVRLYWDSQNNRPAANNPWYNVVSNFANPDAQWGYDFNHESKATQYFVDRITSYWIKEFKVDGYRFDFTKGFSNNYKSMSDSWGSAYDADRIRILKRMTDKIRSADSSAYVIFEHLADNSEEKVLADYGIMLWGNMNYNYNEATMGWIPTSNFSGVSYKVRNFNYPNLVAYMESHDEERLMYKNIQWGNSSGSYNIKDTAQALNRIKLASAFFFTIPGPKMLWQFGELGYDYTINYNGRVGIKPLRWDYYSQPARKKLFKVMQSIIKLKTTYDAFNTTDFSLSADGVIKSIHLNHPTMNVNIIGNFGVDTYTSVSLNFQNTGKWYDYFSGTEINVADNNMPVNLQPGEFHIYTTQKLPMPEADILNDVERDNSTVVRSFALEQNYPNPFNPTTVISYQIASPSNVSLKIYDLLGREIKTLINQQQNSGSYHVEWKGDNNQGMKVSGGLYLYRLESGNYVSTRKMMLIK